AGSAAAVPAGLVAATVKSSLAFVSGSAASGALSPQVLSLAEGALRATGVGRALWATVFLLVLSCGALSAALSLRPTTDDGEASPPVAARLPPDPPFQNVTRECGLEEIVNDKYAASPKW